MISEGSTLVDRNKVETEFGSLFISPLVNKDSIGPNIYDHMRSNLDNRHQSLQAASILTGNFFDPLSLLSNNVYNLSMELSEIFISSNFFDYISPIEKGSSDLRFFVDYNNGVILFDSEKVYFPASSPVLMSELDFKVMETIFYTKLNGLAERVLVPEVKLTALTRYPVYDYTEFTAEILLKSIDSSNPFTLTNEMVKTIQMDFKSDSFFESQNVPIFIESYTLNNEAIDPDPRITKNLDFISSDQMALDPDGDQVSVPSNSIVNLLDLSIKAPGVLSFKYKFNQEIVPANFLRDASLVITLKTDQKIVIESIGSRGRLKGGNAKAIWGSGVNTLSDLECSPGHIDTFWAGQEINCTWARNLYTTNFVGGTGLFTLDAFETKKMCRNPSGYKYNYLDSVILIDENLPCPPVSE
jgi:hypothetical protein